ncbi:putative quinol monooxygenase [Acidipila rosea]|uniref:Quinol monooxygenase YgiN n=1 Tax=Acidipila rosea TaxID=768535 RepID=A0A4V2PUX8_9BACT|nr:putative quinol monooxygenase [Acidipila rosea]MBW4027660.1 antibiotic biosynthesis monooxygenase [Acidobacteriota bacterium]MBW4045367.1 antibiotic biosynthesis monooxygenase [Acidobacteriota bacterium]TCK71561.1 quinol monooxygenase YgiN [Acidipila rosea]
MVSFLVRMRFANDDRARVNEAVLKATEASRKEPGCVTYVPHWTEAEADTLVIYEQYIDTAAHEAHRASAHFQEYVIGGLYQMMRERAVENLSAIL